MGRIAVSAVVLLTALLGVTTPAAGAAPEETTSGGTASGAVERGASEPGAVEPGAAEPGAAGWTKHCEFTPTPDKPAAKPVRPPHPTAPAKGTATAVLDTNYGAVVIRLDRSNAPCAVHNFTHLVRSLFYHHTQCFRLTNSARLGVLQCGDIHRVEEGGPGYRFADEVTGRETYPRGTVAMGNQGPGTNGSQFFIVHSHANITPAYSVLGRVVHGMDTLDRIVAAGIADGAQDGLPRHPVRIHWALTLPF